MVCARMPSLVAACLTAALCFNTYSRDLLTQTVGTPMPSLVAACPVAVCADTRADLVEGQLTAGALMPGLTAAWPVALCALTDVLTWLRASARMMLAVVWDPLLPPWPMTCSA